MIKSDFTAKHVCICAATYFRPGGLRRLLDSINVLDVEPLGKVPRVTVVIVDNDPNGSALSVIEKCRENGFRFDLEYFVECKRGIPQVRNRLLEASKALGADVIAMVDDDESVDEKWLSSGLRAMYEWNADVIFGHLIPIFNPHSPQWIIDGGYFEFPIYENGTSLKEAYTYNVFFKIKILDSVFGFDESLSLSCGEDVLFFREVSREGFSIRFCSLTIVYAHLSKDRISLGWILKRRFNYSIPVELILKTKEGKSTFLLRVWLAFKSIFFIFTALLISPLIVLRVVPIQLNKVCGKFFGPRAEHLLRRLNYGYRGVLWFISARLGVLLGAFGYRFNEYAHPSIETKK